MAASLPHRWITHPEDIDLLNYIIKRTKNVESPANIQRLLRDFKEKSGAAKSLSYLNNRLRFVRTRIHSFEHIDTKTKVKMLFALSAAVDAEFLKELKKNAFVEVDEKNRITHYKAIDGSLELMAQYLSRRWATDPEYIDLLNYIIERTETVESPLNINSLAEELKVKSEKSLTVICLKRRIERMRAHIHSFKHIDTNTKVKLIFALSASVDTDFLEELRKNALVEIDDKNRITLYKAIDGSLELRGDHSLSTKYKTAQRGSKRSYRSLIIDYFENKNNVDAVPKKKTEKEMENLIEFITGKCENVRSPHSICRLTKDFNSYFGLSKSFDYIHGRIKSYCYVIQKTKFLDVHSKVKQLFGLSATLDSECLRELQKDADVEVDDLNRITKYTANNGCLTLYGDHSYLAKSKLGLIEWRRNKKAVKKHCLSADGDDDKSEKEENGLSGEDSDENSSEKIDSDDELDDYDTKYSIDGQVKLEPFRGSIQEDLSEIKEDEDIQQIPKPPQTLDEHNQIEEVPIKLEHGEPVEVKPETSHNSKIKFFEAMQSLIICLDTPSLSEIQLKIHHKIQELEEHDEVILNKEIALAIDLLNSQMTNHSVVNLFKDVESVNLSNFLCYLKSAILNSKMSGVEGLVKNISELIEESQNKRIPMENVANALRATLDIDGF